jgi:hypothetical protein
MESLEKNYGFLRSYVASGKIRAKPLKEYAAYKLLADSIQQLKTELATLKKEIAKRNELRTQGNPKDKGGVSNLGHVQANGQ